MKAKKIKIILCFVLTAIPVFSGFVRAASFDCSIDTLTKVERVICSDQELSQLDDQIAVAYHAAMANAGNKTMLRNRQRGWLRQRNQCKDIPCLKDIYMRRLAELSEGAAVFRPSGAKDASQATAGAVTKEVIERSNFEYATKVGDFKIDYSVTSHTKEGKCKELGCYDITWWFSVTIPDSPSEFEVAYPEVASSDPDPCDCLRFQNYDMVKSSEGKPYNVLEFADLTADGFPDIKLNIMKNTSGLAHVRSAVWVYMPAKKIIQKSGALRN